MAYVGRGIDNISNATILDAITFTNSAGPYNLTTGSGATAFTPISVQALVISVDGVIQSPDSYTISAATITFGVSMASSLTNDFIVHNGVGLITEPSDGSVSTAKIEDLAVTSGKLAADSVITAKILDDNVTTGKILDANVTTAKTSFISTSSTAGVTSKGTASDSDGYVTLNCDQNTHGIKLKSPPHSAAQSYTLTFPQTAPATDKILQTNASGQLSFVTESTYDDNVVQSNIAMLGFKVAVNGSLTRYNLVDQSIDEFYDTSGVDASASTNEQRVASGSNFYYDGGTSPTITEDADDTGTSGDYSWYAWTDTAGTGSYQTSIAQNADILVIAGGGGGALNDGGGAAGAGGFKYYSQYASVGTGSNTITVGAGGTGGTSGTSYSGVSGSNSSFGSLTATGGGGGGGHQIVGLTGGSGGGAGGRGNTAGGSGTANQGNDGGNSAPGASGSDDTGGGGGGASAVGTAGGNGGPGGTGGAGYTEGSSTVYDWTLADGTTATFNINGAGTGYAGGGGGGSETGSGGTATHGGGAGSSGSGNGTIGTANTGGGAGGGTGSGTGPSGGSGIVILRRLTAGGTAVADLTLQSTDVTAEAAPTYGEFVTLIENAYGTATLNTDIKGYISRDSGVTFTQGTLVDEGTWGTNKQVLGFHDLALGGSALTAMCYKITTHNQVASSKETRIYATSIGWR
jgi:hypothetical protein